jgi:type II secretory pathway pseudopilin PulG
MGHRIRVGRGRQVGFTLLEVMIYIGVMMVIGTPLVMVTLSVSRASAEGDVLSKILERNRSALQRILGEYEVSLSGTTVISAGGKVLQFTSNGGFNGTAPVPGAVLRYEIRLATGETANGVDDNHNGLIDEGALVRMNLSTGEETIITGIVDTAASSFVATGNGITVNMATFGRTAGTTAVCDARCSVTMFPRN